MKRKTLVMMILFVMMASSTHAAFKHPGIFSSKEELEFVKQKIAEGKEPWKTAFDKLKAINPTNREPKPVAVHDKNYDGPKDKLPTYEMIRDGQAAYACALLWVFTGEQRYADHGIKILNAWNIFQKPTHPLSMTWITGHFVNAAEILKHMPGSGWKPADIEKFSTMVKKYMWPNVQPPTGKIGATKGSNQGCSANECQFAIAIFLDDRVMFNQAVENYKWLLPKWIFMNQSNRLDGETANTCRDLNHTKMGTRGVVYAAQSAWNQGVDLWKDYDKRYATYAELHAGMIIGDIPVPENLCERKTAGFIQCNHDVTNNPPCKSGEAAWEILYNHISRRLGNELPSTLKMTLRNRPAKTGISTGTDKWETLLHANLSYGMNNIVPSGYTFAADENDTVIVKDQVMDIAYGAYGEYIYLYDQTSNAVCNSVSFGGDPMPDSTKKCYVKPVVFVEGVSLDKHSLDVEIGKTVQINKTISPSNAKNKTVLWSSNDTTIAKVSDGGLVTTMAVGTVTIKVLTNDGDFTDSCEVIVVAEKFPNIEYSDGAQAPNIPENLYDGLTDDDHRWSVNGYPKSVVIDYGETKSFTGAKVFTYQSRSYHYTIAISDSEKSGFTTVVEQTGAAPSQPIEHTFSPFNGRYVKLEVTGATGYSSDWVSINELEMIFSNVLGIGEVADLNNHVSIYPTIADEELNVSLNYEKHGKVDVRIIGAYGQLLLKQNIDGDLSKINISNLASGIYFITIAGSDAQVTRKFIKK